MMDFNDANVIFANSVIDYVKTEMPEGDYWQKVDDHTYYSKIVCCLCTLNEMFADMIDEETYVLEESEEAARLSDTAYGEVVLTKNLETQEVHVSLIAEGSQTISINTMKES